MKLAGRIDPDPGSYYETVSPLYTFLGTYEGKRYYWRKDPAYLTKESHAVQLFISSPGAAIEYFYLSEIELPPKIVTEIALLQLGS